MKHYTIYPDGLKDGITIPVPETIEEAIPSYEMCWSLFSDMLAENAPFYYFIHTIISTNRDLNKGFQKVQNSKVCMIPLIRTALENTLMCYASYILKDSKLDTFTRRYLEGKKISTITISLSPDEYNQIIKHPDKPDVTTSTEVELNNANLTRLMDKSFTGIRNIYLECCGNIHPTKEQIKHYIKSTGYIGDKSHYVEATITPEEIDKYTGWMIEINKASIILLHLWLWCYHHTPFNPEENGTKEIVDMVNEEIPPVVPPLEEQIANLEAKRSKLKDTTNKLHLYTISSRNSNFP